MKFGVKVKLGVRLLMELLLGYKNQRDIASGIVDEISRDEHFRGRLLMNLLVEVKI